MTLCIVQEFIDGRTLEAEIAAKRPDERAVLLILRDLLKILSHLGSLRPPVVHRDLKPQNLMRRRSDESLVLIDFGSVRDVVKDSLAGGSTVAGTFGYMYPEQFAGEATPATDIYGVGATGLALLAGTGPERFLGRDGQLGWHGRVVMSDGLRSLLTGMLETHPNRRPAAAAALALVDELLAGPIKPPNPLPNIAAAKVAMRIGPFERMILGFVFFGRYRFHDLLGGSRDPRFFRHI